MFKNKKKRGFTIIELVVVMAVLAILVALGAPRYIGYTKDAQVTSQASDAKIIENAAYQYALGNDDAWPVGEAVKAEDVSPKTKEIVNAALKAKGSTATFNDLADAGVLRKIDKTKVSPFIRSTKNDIDDFFIVDRAESEIAGYKNELEGTVFKLTAQEDSKGVFHSGIYAEAPAAEPSPEPTPGN